MHSEESSSHLAFLAGDFPPAVGGIQRYVHELVKAVAARGRSVSVIAPRRADAAEIDAGLPCPIVRVAGDSKPTLAFAMARALASEGEAHPIGAVVVTKWMPEGPAYLIARRRLRAPMILLGYGREFMPEPGRPVRGLLQRRVLGAASLCLAISDYTADNFVRAGVARERVRVIGAGVSPEALGGAEDAGRRLRAQRGLGDGFLLLTVARLVRRKGHDLVLRAMAELGDAEPRLRYAIVGDGPERAALEDMVRGLGLGECVILAGAVADAELPAWYAACDAMVMPSRDIPGEPPEGFGLVYLEAGAAGKPVIGARTGGVASAIVDGETGLLVEPEDVRGLTEALRLLTSDAAGAAEMGRRGRERVVAEFTWDHVAGRFLGALAEIV